MNIRWISASFLAASVESVRRWLATIERGATPVGEDTKTLRDGSPGKLPSPHFDPTPDRPQGFGYKVSWFALKTSDAGRVLETLGLRETILANWETGLDAAFGRKGPWAFVSPPVGDWVFIVGPWLPYPDDSNLTPRKDSIGTIGQRFDAMFSILAKRFAEVKFFGTYRVVDFVAWA